MSTKEELKAEKRFKVNALGVVESVEVAPPLREADQQNKNNDGKKSGWYNTGNKVSGIGGNIVDENNTTVYKGNINRKIPKGGTKSNKKSYTNNSSVTTNKVENKDTKTKNKEYSLPLILLAIIAFITIFDIGGSDDYVNNVIPEPDEVVVSNTSETVFSYFFEFIKTILSFIWSIISFIFDLLFSILGLK